MNILIENKDYKVEFAYEPTLKSRLLSRVARMGNELNGNEDDYMDKIEDILLFIPEIMLVGLQKHHSDEFGYNLDNKAGYDTAKDKVFKLVAEYLDSGENDAIELFEQLQEEMTRNGFLKKMFEREVAKAEQKEQRPENK